MSTPKEYTFSFEFSHIPPVMLRGTHTLIIVKDREGKYILGSKHIYPPGIYRLVGGGIDLQEEPVIGASRELQEELGVTVPVDSLNHLATITAHVSDPTQHATFVTYLFYTDIGSQTINPADDLDDIVRFSKQEMRDLISRFAELTDDVVQIDKDYGPGIPSTPFSWKDYGTFYGKVHEIALELSS